MTKHSHRYSVTPNNPLLRLAGGRLSAAVNALGTVGGLGHRAGRFDQVSARPRSHQATTPTLPNSAECPK